MHESLVMLLFILLPSSFCYNKRIFFQEEVLTETVAPPEHSEIYDGLCGFLHRADKTRFITEDDIEHHPYHFNVTAERLAAQGFNIVVHELLLDSDAIWNFTYSNETFSENKAFQTYQRHYVSEKEIPIRREVYMALLGERKGNVTKWYCDGVLINRQWILTAAHCFIEPGIFLNSVRLGEYNIEKEHEDLNEERFPLYNDRMDFEIERFVPYPDFKIDQRYHDLILVKLAKMTPYLSRRMSAICLPWGNETSRNLVGQNLTLSGWGKTSATALTGSPVLLHVDLEVFETEVCNNSYSLLNSFKTRYPLGMTDQDVLCVGSRFGEKDACQGDSGGPLVYFKDFPYKHFVLGGIVSGGFGCGKKEFPGLYVPINKPKYLKWIRKVAFEEE